MPSGSCIFTRLVTAMLRQYDESYLNAQILVDILPIKTVGVTVADCRYERSVDRPLGHAVVKVQEL